MSEFLESYFTVVSEKDEIFLNSSKRKDSVVLNKMSHNVTFRERTIDFKNKKKYFAMLGLINSAIFDYLLVVPEIKRVATILDAHIFSVEKVKIFF